MRLVSHLVRARYRDQILFRPAKNGNVNGGVMIRRRGEERVGENSNVAPADTLDTIK
ncbi:MAG: hypothetical protein KC800_20140 [Candidatus Eremiobacteraeota bacterium]|nr:hypothetical protein [Candidatus Eremiobacteraeota bacterium]